MHTCGRSFTAENSEERRNRILRARCGDTPAGRKTAQERSRSRSSLTNSPYGKVVDFLVVGQTLNPFMRLPQISRHDVTTQKRNLANGKRERISFLALKPLSHSVDDLLIESTPAITKPIMTQTNTDDVTNEVFMQRNVNEVLTRRNVANRRNSLDLKTSKTVSDDFGPLRRWSDSVANSSESGVISVKQREEYKRSLGLKTRGMNLVKSDSTISQSAEEVVREYKEFARKREIVNDEGKNSSPSSATVTEHTLSELGNQSVMKKLESLLQRNMTESSFSRRNAADKPRPQRRHTTNLIRNKTKILMPSGDSTGTSGTSVDRVPSLSKTGGSTSKLLNKRNSSRAIMKRNSYTKKSDSNMKNKKVPPRPESPPGPSEEEMQEIQDLPVIRKFLKMPPSKPKVVCFDYPGIDLTHLDVKRAIEKVIPGAFESGKVVSVRFENVNVKLATGGLDNRWYVELKDFATRNLLIKNGLSPESPDKNSLTDVRLPGPAKSEEATTSDAEDEGITFPPINYPKSVKVKLYDSVSMEEYKLYLRRTAAEEKLQNVILLCAGRGDKLLSSML